MTEAEYKRRYTREHTDAIAVKCLFCGYIDEVKARFSDGCRCPSCGRQASAIGYLKPDNKPKQDRPPQKKPEQRESAEQEALFRWAGFVHGRFPEIEWLYHIPNGGSRNRIEAANLKRQGVKAGVPDLCLPVARGGFHGLYIEMKAGKNTTTDKQDEWLSALQRQGYAVAVCYGWERASEVITKYLESGD